MSDRASHATQPSESDFHDSHPIDNSDDESTPSIGDLTSIESSIDTPASQPQSIGDLSTVDDSPQSEILGDISLLDEAFAEMDESAALNNTDIPVLNDSIDTPLESRILPIDMNASVPLLNEEATVFAEMLKPASNVTNAESSTVITEAAISELTIESSNSQPLEMAPISSPASQLSEIKLEDSDATEATDEEGPLFDAPEAQNNSNINEIDSSLGLAAELLSESAPSVAQSEIDQVDNDSSSDDSSDELGDEPNISSVEIESAVESDSGSSALQALLDDDISAPELNDPDVESDISDLQLDIASEISSSLDSSPASFQASTSNAEDSSPELEPETGPEIELEINSTSIDEKIAMASGESEIEINEVPINSLSAPSEFPTSFAEGLIGSQPSTFVDDEEQSELSEELSEELSGELSEEPGENLSETPSTEPTRQPSEVETSTDAMIETQVDSQILSTEPEHHATDTSEIISEFNPEVDLNSEAITQASHSIGITTGEQAPAPEQKQNNLNLSIPFELHSQLSKKIDELVIEATSSITEELHSQLTSKLDSLLGSAVESVLPKLVDQMATELRSEVNGRIKQQLPSIIDDVLNKTRLHK